MKNLILLALSAAAAHQTVDNPDVKSDSAGV
jgi:hypothetical protein